MSLLSDFYIATPENAIRYDSNHSLPATERAEFTGLTYHELADLRAALQKTEPTPAYAESFESVLVVDKGERLINRFPAEFVSMLAALDESSAADAAARWVQMGEMAFLSCEPSDVRPMVDELVRLAQAAQQSGKSLYLWMCV